MSVPMRDRKLMTTEQVAGFLGCTVKRVPLLCIPKAGRGKPAAYDEWDVRRFAKENRIDFPMAKLRRPGAEPEWVYFISTWCGRYVKIGISKKPYARLKALQAHNAEMLDIVDMLEGDITLERALHRKFKPHRGLGEWFQFVDPIHDFIDSIDEEPAW